MFLSVCFRDEQTYLADVFLTDNCAIIFSTMLLRLKYQQSEASEKMSDRGEQQSGSVVKIMGWNECLLSFCPWQWKRINLVIAFNWLPHLISHLPPCYFVFVSLCLLLCLPVWFRLFLWTVHLHLAGWKSQTRAFKNPVLQFEIAFRFAAGCKVALFGGKMPLQATCRTDCNIGCAVTF